MDYDLDTETRMQLWADRVTKRQAARQRYRSRAARVALVILAATSIITLSVRYLEHVLY